MNSRKFLFLAVIMSFCLVVWGCPKKAEVTSTEPQTAAGEQGAAAGTEKAAGETGAGERAGAGAAAVLQPVYFDFDKSFVRGDAKAIMKGNADWMKANPKAKVRIEGNCDERGTKEYNQALGQRRAANAKKYLTDLGISANRISLISYGKEKPTCTNATEECWQKNRRDDFVAITK